MLGSSNGAGRGTVGVGIGVECVALGAAPLGEELVTVEPERRRSSTTSTIPTTPTTSAVAVVVAATATRVVLPTHLCHGTDAPKRTRASDGYNLITSLAQIGTKPFDKLRAASVEPRVARRRVRRSEGTCFSSPMDDERGGLQSAIRAERA